MRRAALTLALTAACAHPAHHPAPAPTAADDGLRHAMAEASRNRVAPTTSPGVATAPHRRRVPPPAVRPPASPPVAAGDVWRRLAQCESGGNPLAVSPSGRFFGAFQFLLSTWHSLGMAGNPIDHPYAVQLAAAQRLQRRSGWGQWPVCSRRAGAW